MIIIKIAFMIFNVSVPAVSRGLVDTRTCSMCSIVTAGFEGSAAKTKHRADHQLRDVALNRLLPLYPRGNEVVADR